MRGKETEVARVRRQIETEHQACVWALTGLSSGNVRHAYITRRMRHLDQNTRWLSHLIGEEQALSFVCEIFEQSPPQRVWRHTQEGEG